MNEEPITECTICSKPLGQESRDLGYPFCHECRMCRTCNKPLSAAECKWCVRNEKEPVHAQCITPDYKDDPLLTIRKSEYDRLDLCRLAFIVNQDLSSGVDIENARLAGIQLFGTLNLEEKQVQIAKITEVLYAIQELSQKDPKYRKGMLQERDRKIAQEQAKARDAKVAKVKDAKAESRPALIDVNLEEFAKRWEYTEQEAKTQLTSYKKQIKVMTDIMGNLEKATQAVDEVMTKGLEARRRA